MGQCGSGRAMNSYVLLRQDLSSKKWNSKFELNYKTIQSGPSGRGTQFLPPEAGPGGLHITFFQRTPNCLGLPEKVFGGKIQMSLSA